MKFSIFYPVGWYGKEPASLKFLYDRACETAKIAEDLGFEAIYYNEGHCRHPNYKLPNPRLLIAAAAQHTSRIFLGTAVTALGLQDPRFVAEDAVMLDALTNGRFILGIGSGASQHYEELGFNPHARKKINEFKVKILDAFLQDQVVHMAHELFRASYSRLAVTPENPDLRRRMRQGAVSVEGAHAIGAAGWGVIYTPKNTPLMKVREQLPILKEAVDAYYKGWSASTRAQEPALEPMVHLPCHFAYSDEQCRVQIAAHWNAYQGTFYDRSIHPEESFYDMYLQDDISLFGSVERVRARIEKVREAGVPHVLCLFNIGGIAHELMVETMTQFAQEIMPHFAGSAAPPETERQLAHA